MNQQATPPTVVRSMPDQVGPFAVQRALPNDVRHSVGPFVLIDHASSSAVGGGLLPAHPHAGIEVMTYVVRGVIRHLDSLGNDQTVRSGGVQFMASGNGILHAEEVIASEEAGTEAVQLWTRTTLAQQEQQSTYLALQAEQVPVVPVAGGQLKVLAGRWDVGTEVVGPTPFSRNGILAHLSLQADQELLLPVPVGAEVGVLVMHGAASVDGASAQATELVMAGQVSQLHLRSGPEATELLILGGDPIRETLIFGGPFVFESQARMRRAYEDYRTGRMGRLLGVPF